MVFNMGVVTTISGVAFAPAWSCSCPSPQRAPPPYQSSGSGIEALESRGPPELPEPLEVPEPLEPPEPPEPELPEPLELPEPPELTELPEHAERRHASTRLLTAPDRGACRNGISPKANLIAPMVSGPKSSHYTGESVGQERHLLPLYRGFGGRAPRASRLNACQAPTVQ